MLSKKNKELTDGKITVDEPKDKTLSAHSFRETTN